MVRISCEIPVGDSLCLSSWCGFKRTPVNDNSDIITNLNFKTRFIS